LAAAYFAGSKAALIIGLSAAISAAISMGLSEALSDSEGSGSGRGSPLNRGLITGGATLIGGIVHVLPFLISDVKTALLVAYIVLAVELLAVAWIRQHFLRVSLWRSIIQIVLGGIIIAAVGITLGSQG
jgi:VIT1/CCC1 family predicted Fe2+/Mn2+ transporter